MTIAEKVTGKAEDDIPREVDEVERKDSAHHFALPQYYGMTGIFVYGKYI